MEFNSQNNYENTVKPEIITDMQQIYEVFANFSNNHPEIVNRNPLRYFEHERNVYLTRNSNNQQNIIPNS